MSQVFGTTMMIVGALLLLLAIAMWIMLRRAARKAAHRERMQALQKRAEEQEIERARQRANRPVEPTPVVHAQFGRRQQDKEPRPKVVTGSVHPGPNTRDIPGMGMFDPLNPLSPISPISVWNTSDNEPARSESRCDPSPSYESSSSYSSSDSGSSSSSCDSGSSSSDSSGW